MELLSLFLATILFLLGCYLSYLSEYRQTTWFVWVGVFLGILTNFLWFYTIKCIDDKQKIYIFSLTWDAIMVFIYYGLPLIIFGVKLDKYSLLGLILLVTGIIVLKAKT